MNNQIWQAIGTVIIGIIGFVITAIVSIFAYYAIKKYVPILRAKTAKWLDENRSVIRDRVKDWLHKNNLEESKLLDVYMVVDTVAGDAQKFLYTVHVETKETGKVKINQYEITIEEFRKIDTTKKEKIIEEIGQTSILSQVM
ncbi:hypothetical protein NIES4073_58280 [Kalymmatonema gypsitolerans NIES-4073]|nr:hypothetical protein NIES4073_58280 [Scytonema sp. NIES-4073]